jgi:hypothetical protein
MNIYNFVWNRLFEHASKTLLFNKIDIARDQLKDNYQQAMQSLQNTFLAQNEGRSPIYCHYMTAHERENVRATAAALLDMIIRHALNEAGLV